MIIWNEYEKDIFSYFQWFNKDGAFKRVGTLPSMSVFSINASQMLEPLDKIAFIELCVNVIVDKFTKDEFLSKYSLYLFANVIVKERLSRIEKYKKLWKKLQSDWQIDSFNKGFEIEMEVGNKTFFSSIAGLNYENLSTALKIVSSNPKMYTIIASSKNGVLSEKVITNTFGLAFNLYSQYMDEIDYFNLSIHLCPEGDVVFRWGESSEEAELAMIFNPGVMLLNERK